MNPTTASLRELIAFYRDAGVDALLVEEPVDRFADEPGADTSATDARPRRQRRSDRGQSRGRPLRSGPGTPAPQPDRCPARRRGGLASAASATGAGRRDHGGARRREIGGEPRRTARAARGVRRLHAARHRDAACVRGRHAEVAGDVRRRSAGARRGPQRCAVRRPLRTTARPDDGRRSGSTAAAPTSPTSCRGARPATARRHRRKPRSAFRSSAVRSNSRTPIFLVCLGQPATQTLLGTREGISRTRGRWFKFDTGSREIRALPTYHPAFLLRSPLQKRLVWRDFLSLKKALSG